MRKGFCPYRITGADLVGSTPQDLAEIRFEQFEEALHELAGKTVRLIEKGGALWKTISITEIEASQAPGTTLFTLVEIKDGVKKRVPIYAETQIWVETGYRYGY